MRVGLDLTALRPQRTGVDAYLCGLHRGLVADLDGLELVVFVNREDVGEFPDEHPGLSVVAGSSRSRRSRLWFQQVRLPLAARELRLDVVHSPAFLIPLWRGRARHVVTVYDLTILTMPEHHDRLHRSFAFRRALVTSIRRAHRICVPTDAVAVELAALLPESADRVRVVRPGLAPGLAPSSAPAAAAATQRLGLRRPFVLYVGTLEPRKNLRRLVAAFKRLLAAGAEEDLVLAGRLGWDCENLLADLADPELSARVHRLNYVPAEDLAALYSAARLFVYPSLAEGFGFPPLEAMACGVPVVASRDAALSENLGDAAELVDATDTAALAAAIARVLADPELAAELRRRGLRNAARFSWAETARATVSCYRELVPSCERATAVADRARAEAAIGGGG
jgi:glycosyltransferase involved in cell wall biosynthesis